jgi:flagellar biosynthesis/type III secretory pathway M-ring protein FliF/YscJ
VSTLKSQWGRAGTSLARLSPVQRRLALTLVTVMIATGAWWSVRSVRSAASAMEPVLAQKFADADVVQITDHLRARGVTTELRDGRILVPADRKLDALSDLIYSELLAGNTESGFDALIKQTSVWDTPSKTDKMFNRAREVTLEGVVRRFKGVRKATVIIDPTNERHIGGSITPSALVDIQTRPGAGAAPRQLATAAVNAVTGAVSTMSREKVRVTIDGASYNVPQAETEDAVANATAAADVLERRQQCEQMYATKVRSQLKFIPDLLVSVSVDLNLESQEEEKRTVDPDNYLQVPTKVETRAPDIGVIANGVPAAEQQAASTDAKPARDASAGVGGAASTTEYAIHASETVQKTRSPAGKETVVSASVAVPRSYFVNVYKRSSRKSEVEPDDALLQPIVDVHLGKIRGLVRNTLGLRSDDVVSVEVYEDAKVEPPPPPGTLTATAGAKEAASVVGPQVAAIKALAVAHGKELGYAAAGVGTLLMASLVLRRGSTSGALVAPAAVRGSPEPTVALQPGRHRLVVPPSRREVLEESDGAEADGEQDDEPHADLLRQVRELATREPDRAARVLREWIYED